MSAYEDWNKLDDDEEDELQDNSVSVWHLSSRRLPLIFHVRVYSQAYEGRKDVILFCIDCSPSMLELREDSRYEDVQTCHLFTALEAAIHIQKKKVIVGPNDSVGIMLFNTVTQHCVSCLATHMSLL